MLYYDYSNNKQHSIMVKPQRNSIEMNKKQNSINQQITRFIT